MPKQILAVDDEPNIRRLLEVNLQRAGYQVMTAWDGQDALEKLLKARPDLVLLDVMMPRVDGFEVLRRLKADPGTAAIPVLMLTARAQDADIFNGLRSGADFYLTKPFNPTELLMWVRRVLENTGPAAGGGGTIPALGLCGKPPFGVRRLAAAFAPAGGPHGAGPAEQRRSCGSRAAPSESQFAVRWRRESRVPSGRTRCRTPKPAALRARL